MVLNFGHDPKAIPGTPYLFTQTVKN